MKSRLSISAGPGLRCSNGRNGVVISQYKGVKVQRRLAPGHPFRLRGFVQGGEARISVQPGLVNNVIPTIDGVSIATFDTDGNGPYLVVTGTAGVVIMRATLTIDGDITALELANVATLDDVPDDIFHPATPIYKYRVVGTWQSSSGQFTSVTSILNTNQAMLLCGGAAIWG